MIAEHKKHHHTSPTLRQLAAGLGLRGHVTVHKQIVALERKGLLLRLRRGRKALYLLVPPEQVECASLSVVLSRCRRGRSADAGAGRQ